MLAKPHTFQESVDYLLSLGNEVSAMKLGLENIRRLLAALGDPQNNYLKVQVAGTNGKGSVCAFLDSICNTAEIKTGTFTSPHLVSIIERIRINGEDINETDFARHATFVRDTAENLLEKGGLEYRPTFFELITAIALVAFAEARIEVAILETGLGGRLDATTAANAEIAAITRIDYDHQQYLGETIEEIAAEKAAIIHEGSKVVIGDQDPKAMAVVLQRCRDFGISPRSKCEKRLWSVDPINRSLQPVFVTENNTYDEPDLGLKGRHQLENACIAILVAETLLIDFDMEMKWETVVEGLEKARHTGRLEFIDNILLDGAHNPGGAKALRAFLDEFVPQPIVIVFGAMADKNVAEIARILFYRAETLILTKVANSRAIDPADLQKFVPSHFDPNQVVLTETAESALAEARKLARHDKLILVTGSLYLVGEVKSLLSE